MTRARAERGKGRMAQTMIPEAAFNDSLLCFHATFLTTCYDGPDANDVWTFVK